jgi:methyl-accepting chemotaxis protein
MKRFRLVDLPLIVKMGFAPAVAVIMLAVIVSASLMVENRQAKDLQRVTDVELPVSLGIERLSKRITAVHGELYRVLTQQAANIDTKNVPDQLQAVIKEIRIIEGEVLALKKTTPADQHKALDSMVASLKDCESAIDLASNMVGVDFGAAAGFIAPFEDQYQKMTATLDKIVASNQAEVIALAKANHDAAEGSIRGTIIGGIATLLIVGGLAAVSALNMRKAIIRIAGATETLAKGNSDVELEGLKRKDELGAVVESLVVFRDDQRRLAQLSRDQEAARAEIEQERQRNEAAQAAIEADQRFVVDGLASGMEQLSSGNLTFRLIEAFPGKYAKLQNDFNEAMGKLQEAMVVISNNTEAMRTGAGDISHAADDLSRRTEQQAATLEETAAAIDEITATVKKTSDGANQANATVAVTREEAERSGEVVRQAVAAMTQIEKSSSQITQIIGVIDEIAFQTNLLALNAGVEAARAGDAGRGFAVVASEVRALAQRSAQAAKEIKSLISMSSEQVDSGVDLVGQAGEALNRIVGKVSEISGLVGEIAASAREQSTALHEVNTAVNQMDQVTQQNAAMVEESTAASHSLAEEADELARLVARFQIGAGAAAQAAHSSRPSSRQTTVAALKTVGGRGASAARKPAAEEQGWEEF